MKISIILATGTVFLSTFAFADNENYEGQDVSGMYFSDKSLVNSNWSRSTAVRTYFDHAKLTNANFSNANLTSAFFYNANITGANFGDATLTGAIFEGATINDVNFKDSVGFTAEQVASTLSFRNKDLSYTSVCTDISGLDLTDFNITGMSLSGTNLRAEQLYSTANYKNKNLRNVGFYTGDYSGWNFVGQNLQNTSWKKSTITNADATGADLRGAYFPVDDYTGEFITKNTIMTDGKIQNFSMKSEADNLVIREYVPKYSGYGNDQISAKIVENASISGGAKLTLEKGAELEITNGKTLTISSDGIIQIDTDLSGSTKFTVDSNAGLTFEDGATLTVNITDDTPLTSDVYEFAVISFTDDSRISGLSDFVKDKTLFLTVNGSKFSGAWDYALKSDGLYISLNIPEPATYAAIFGLLALGFAAWRRRKHALAK